MPLIMIEDYQEFSVRHGGNPVEVHFQRGGRRVSSGWLVFPDGAMCSVSDAEFRKEPPHDPTEQLKTRRDYVNEVLERAISDFNHLKSECHHQEMLASRYRNFTGPSADAPAQLRRLRAIVEARRTELRKLDAQLADTPEARDRQMRNTLDQELEHDCTDLMNEIKAIQI